MTISRKRAADVRVGDVILAGSVLYRSFTVRATSDAGFVLRERRRASSHPHRLGEIISSKQVRLITFHGRAEMAESRTYAADQYVSIIDKEEQ